jgi:hypothetical protein
MGKYDKFRAAVREEQEYQKEQQRLHRKHDEIDPDAVIVEKVNMLKFLLSYFRGIAKALSGVVLILLAAIGVLALLYPAPRGEVMEVLAEIAAEIRGFFGR